MFCLLEATHSLTMLARLTTQIIFTVKFQFGVAWVTVCDQDAFRTVLVGREHSCRSTSGTNMRRALRSFPDLEAASTPK